MKNILLLISILFTAGFTCAQRNDGDSLLKIINLHKSDTAEVIALAYMGSQQTQMDSAIMYAQQGIALAEKLNYLRGKGYCLLTLSLNFGNDWGKSLQLALKALEAFESINDNTGMASAHLLLQGIFWYSTGDYKNSLVHAFVGKKIAEDNNVIGVTVFSKQRLAPLFLAEIGQIYLLRNQLDSAEFYAKQSIAQNELFNGAKWNFPVYLLAYAQTMKGDYIPALNNFHYALSLAKSNAIFRDTLQVFSGLSTLFKKMGRTDSSIYYAQMTVHSGNPELEKKNLLESLSNLAEGYKVKGEQDSVIKYIEFYHALKDSIFSRDRDREIQGITFSLQLKERETVAAQQKYKSSVQLYAMTFGLLAVLLVAGLLLRNNLHRKKAYSLLEKQKDETDNQKQKVETALEKLESTQSQLIQSEKMASLGELTAGIAHEIQNPLNFVNNFSEVSNELIAEMTGELEKGDVNEAKAIAKDVKANLEKINHHGKRAADIVKGMLQHSRTSSGQKELTDINTLCDEYLRLSYHGLRAKDKSFNAKFETDFDSSLPKINVVPHDIGRVVLNLINNAFYAVSERLRQAQPDSKYEPTVIVSTHFSLSSGEGRGEVKIKVKDNGNGIPQNIVDKIFQPFFTTKPTGQGTGLGLSLSYDIVKAHGGVLKVRTKEDEGSEFTILIPE